MHGTVMDGAGHTEALAFKFPTNMVWSVWGSHRSAHSNMTAGAYSKSVSIAFMIFSTSDWLGDLSCMMSASRRAKSPAHAVMTRPENLCCVVRE